MKLVNNYPVCSNCKHSHLHHCDKYDDLCFSVDFGGKRYQLPCNKCLDEDGFEEGIPETKVKPDKIAYIHLPGIEYFRSWRALCRLRDLYPEAFYDNRDFSEIYGAFPGCIWNGRTPNFEGPHWCIEDINDFRQEVESLGLSINLTWNNHLVSGTDVYDRYCNAITEVFHNGKHSITVASLDLYHYLKEKYPNFTYYQSVIPTSNSKVGLDKMDNGFDMVLWTRTKNNDWDELLKVPVENRDKIEFLCNDACTPLCNRMGHYNIVNKCLLDRRNENCYIGHYCTIDHDFLRFNCNHWPISINTEDIDIYLNEGFCHFKIAGRGDAPAVVILKAVKYLIKPQYLEDAFEWIIYEKGVNNENNNK